MSPGHCPPLAGPGRPHSGHLRIRRPASLRRRQSSLRPAAQNPVRTRHDRVDRRSTGVAARGAHTGLMATRNTLSTRWVTVIMVVALVCSVVVVWGLIQITGQSPASSSTPAASASAAESGPGSTAGGGSAPSTTDAPSGGGNRPDDAATDAEGQSGGATPGADRSTSVTTTAPTLPGTGLPLPAAWTGTADMTITVLGRCAATGGTSSYTRTADLALQGPVLGTGPFDDPNPLSMTLGITPADIPGLSIYSASTDRSGQAQRWWWLTTGQSL